MAGVVIALLCQRVWTDGAGRTPLDDGVTDWMIDSVGVSVSLVKEEEETVIVVGDVSVLCGEERQTVTERGSKSETNNVACERAGVTVRVLMIIRNVCGL